MLGGAILPTLTLAVTQLPPGDLHSHHNDGDEQMTYLIVQDRDLYYQCRTMGFAYAD